MTTRHLIAQRIVALGFLALIFASLLGAQKSPVAAALARGEKIPVLFFGVDAADASRHTDTLMLGLFDPIKNYLSVLSIPRDTRVVLPGYRFNRVNEIYGYQLRKTKDKYDAAHKVLMGLEYVLSSEAFRPSLPYFVQLDFSGFRKMVDLLGGVWVTVKQPMDYDDNAGNYHFHKQPGRYFMNGEEALLYVRFRGATGDRGRIFRQQEFVRGLIRRLANPLMVLRLPEMAAVVKETITSNLSLWDMLYFADAVRHLRSDGIGFYILPGQMAGPYWAPKKDMVRELSELLFLGKVSTLNVADTITSQSDLITVKVWNASGKSGWGYGMAKFLRKSGYDVVDWGNYAQEQLQTRVIDRTGKISNAQQVAASLGVDNFHSEPNLKALVDVEVVIGQNYTGITQ